MKVTKKSTWSGNDNTLDLNITQEQLDLWDNGRGPFIQRVFPNLTADEREFLLTGMTKEEWDEAFPSEDDDELTVRDRKNELDLNALESMSPE